MRPVTLCFSGLDPSGGAGLQADIEAIAAVGGHAAVVATALTVQDSNQVYDYTLVDPRLQRAQAERVLADLPVRAVKLGMLGAPEAIDNVLAVLADHPALPLVLDPVLAANSGGNLAGAHLIDALLRALPRTTVITPNSIEARRLAGCDALDDAVTRLTRAGARAIWLKGGHEPGADILNRLYIDGQLVRESRLPRLPGEFHGSGCTLAAALAAGLAAGLSLVEATQRSEAFVQQALQAADRPRANGQWLPRRIRGGQP